MYSAGQGENCLMKTVIFLLLPFWGLLSGCAAVHSPGQYTSPDIRKTYSSPSDMSNDVSRVPEGPLTLHQAIQTAIANNPGVAAREWDTKVAQAKRDNVFGSRLPELRFVGDYYHHLDEQRILPVGVPGEPSILSRHILSGDIILSMPLFTGGRLVNQVKAAELLQKSAEHHLARSREELVFNVTRVFNSILAQKHVIGSLDFSKKNLKEHLLRIDALIAARKAAPVDRLRTEVRLADIEQQLVREKNLQSVQQRALAHLLGFKDMSEGPVIRGELNMQVTFPVPELEAALSTAFQSRGDYRAARAALEAQVKNVDIARSGHWPTLFMQGAYGGRWAVGSTTGTGDEQGDVGRVGLVLEVPIFEGGQVTAKIREQRAALAAAQERFRLLDLQVRLEVEIALLDVQSLCERAAAIRKSIVQAQESLRIEQQKYDHGKGAIVDVLDAQSALLQSETTYYRVLAEYHTALARLNLAMGVE